MVLAQAQEQLQGWRAQLLPPQVLIDLDDTAVRIAALALGRRGRIRQMLSVALPDGACSGGLPRQITALGDFLGDLLVEHGLVQAEVQACLPPAACRWRLLDWGSPEPPANPLALVRERQAELRLDWALDTAFVDVVPVAGQPELAMLVAAPQELVRAWQQVFDLAGAQLVRLDAAQCCEPRAMEQLWRTEQRRGELAGTVDLVLGLEPRGSWLWLADGGLPEADWWLPQLLFPFTTEAVGELAAALLQRQRYWQERHPQAQRWRCWLHGPLSQQPGLAEALAQQLAGPATALAVQPLDCVAQGWLSLPKGSEGRGLDGALLLRLSGLLAAEHGR